jgi:hypothetical protein
MTATNNKASELNTADLDSVTGGGVVSTENASGSHRSGGGGGGVPSKLYGEFSCAVNMKRC